MQKTYLIDLVCKNIKRIPLYKNYATLVALTKQTHRHTNEYYIQDLGLNGSAVIHHTDTLETLDNLRTTGEVELKFLLTLEVKLETYSYIYQLGVENPTELQILNAILHFDETVFC